MSDQKDLNPNLNIPPKISDESIDKASVNELKDLIKLMMLREKRELQKEQEEETRRVARDSQRNRNASSRTNDLVAKQARCQHLKGGKHRHKNAIKDYNLSLHTYIDASQVVRCLNCRAVWMPGDTTETIIRNGKQLPNHTKISWELALAMFTQSSNTQSQAEIPMKGNPTARAEVISKAV